jgi:hypothetical protein
VGTDFGAQRVEFLLEQHPHQDRQDDQIEEGSRRRREAPERSRTASSIAGRNVFWSAASMASSFGGRPRGTAARFAERLLAAGSYFKSLIWLAIGPGCHSSRPFPSLSIYAYQIRL